MSAYTDSVPVLTEARIAEIASHKWDFDVRGRVRVSATPDVLAIQNMREPDLSVCVYRPEFPQAVQDFVSAALELLGGHSPYTGTALFLDDKAVLSYRGVGKNVPLTAAYFAEKYAGIEVKLIEAFADHFLTSLRCVLSQLPKGTQLEHMGRLSEYQRNINSHSDLHIDHIVSVLMQYSDPGTPYMIRKPVGGYASDLYGGVKINGSFRTQAGDVSIHGKDVWHGLSSSPPLPTGRERSRLFQAMKVVLIS